ncbi:MAG: SH3 domain-containing protein [Candidatus Promineifilaceae bacterium]|nr:SH3 domain-containing protein [Candidatus Promineifilaceae bacterium]
MARYEKPPDPRESELKPRRSRRLRGDSQESVPWLWLGLGVVVTIVGIVLALALVNALLEREPLATTLPTPTIIRLTAPPTEAPTPTVDRPTPTPIPTLTPAPTRDLSNPPDEIEIGYYAAVSGTGTAGLTVRGGPSTDNVRLLRAAEGTLMLVIDGPEEGGDFTWWQVRLLDGTEGWVAGEYLAPAAAPGTGAGETPAEEPEATATPDE